MIATHTPSKPCAFCKGTAVAADASDCLYCDGLGYVFTSIQLSGGPHHGARLVIEGKPPTFHHHHGQRYTPKIQDSRYAKEDDHIIYQLVG